MSASEPCEMCGRTDGKHDPTEEPPTMEELEDWVFDVENARATDGCEVEPDGICPHGHQSWMRVLGMI